MKYIELKIHASSQGVEAVTEMLMRNGITAISVDDPADLQDILDKKNEYGWDYIDDAVKEHPDREPQVKVYLEDTEEGQKQLQELKIQVMKLKSLELEGKFGWDVDFGRLYAESRIVDDEDWKDKWKEYFKPTAITDRLVVKPSWEEYDAKAGQLVIEIDPGMAFGTGTHETTRLCMALLQFEMQRLEQGSARKTTEAGKDTGVSDPAERIKADADRSKADADRKNPRVLDVGCGSGILAMGAALLGCRQVLGIEIDPDAVDVARENVLRNGLEDRIRIRQGDLTEGVDVKADIIVANLMADLVMKLAPAACDHLEQGGAFISSGILLEKKDLVAAAVGRAGFTLEMIARDGEWCAILARKK